MSLSGLYASSKAAVHTFSETLACEVAPFNINVLIFEPGGFRSRGTIEGGIDTSNPIPDYNDTRENMLEMRNRASEIFRGDPRKLMEFPSTWCVVRERMRVYLASVRS
jgi:NAD(P)-dependent dehydrogenase (short-subunit alcohol dehydrogenase family)